MYFHDDDYAYETTPYDPYDYSDVGYEDLTISDGYLAGDMGEYSSASRSSPS